MKKEIGKEAEINLMIFLVMVVVLVIVFLMPSMVSAGWIQDFKNKITGKFTQDLTVNITVGVPVIRNVYNKTMTDVSTTLNSGPANTSIIINFSVFLDSGVANMDNATATINFSKNGEDTRENSTCLQYEVGGNSANYTCNVSMMWFDVSGAWAIHAFIADINGNAASNKTKNFSVGQTVGSQLGSLIFSALAPGDTNKSSDLGLLVNNTGNKAIPANATQINATNLRGETDPTLAIWAENISVSWDLTANEACDASGGDGIRSNNLTNTTFVNITTANLTKGNFLLNNNFSGQERYYFCIVTVGAELTSQSYSTASKGAWQYFIELAPLIFIRKRKKKQRRNKLDRSINKFISNV